MHLTTALMSSLATMALAAEPPQRIVSLDLCMDWALAHHADPARVAALSPLHLRYPIEWLSELWPNHDGSLEQIVQLQPDLVLAGQYSALLLRERLNTLGYPVQVLPLPATLEQVESYERRLLELMGRNSELAQPAPAPSTPQPGAKRLLLLGSNGIGTGRDTFEHQIIEQAGWRNYLTDSGHVQLDLERIASDPPDAILFAAPEHQALANRFAEHPVLRRSIPADGWLSTDYWRWQCPGPWTWDLIRQLNQWLD
ncbi:ABC transporter substrate-binding protein [Pseudomonas saudimassiliensis]|uniref:ABC transporter substrate-binding protein n=1 Tax=Pseudomonas saudimassiliensis TaxID=1461581 RepID=UPI001EF5ED7D|nr:ABC transporter substrate-binding protein [Pseudomonas saudimassiliensis]